MHFGNAHTDGDTVVYFTNLKVVAVGDLFTPGTPEPDFSAGGSLVGWGPVLAQDSEAGLRRRGAEHGTDGDQGRPGSVQGQDRYAGFPRDALVKKGVAKDQLMAQLKTDDLGWRFSFTGDQLDRFYAELSRGEVAFRFLLR